MRLTLGLLLATLLAGGCTKKSPRLALRSAPPPAENANALANANSQEAITPSVPAQSSAEQWGEMLHGPDPMERVRASRALSGLGENGLPQLIAGMRSISADVRLLSLEALQKPTVIAQAETVMPPVLVLLEDKSPRIRQQAALRLTWLASRLSEASLAKLQSLAKNDTDPDVRRTASEAVLSIQYASSRTKPKSP